MPEEKTKANDEIELSDVTNALLDVIAKTKPRDFPDDYTKLTVSRAVSLLAIAYEKVRNAIEYQEEHLIRRAAIERILKRRFSINPKGEGEAENLLRELLWARYFPKNSLGEDDVHEVQIIIDKYLTFRDELLKQTKMLEKDYVAHYLMDLMTCEIEEALTPDASAKTAYYTYYIYQTLRNTIKLDGVSGDQKDLYFLVALEKAYRKSDRPYQRYHVFNLFYKPLAQFTEDEIKGILPKASQLFQKIDQTCNNTYVDRLVPYAKRQLPAFLILFEIIDEHPKDIKDICTSREALWEVIEKKCNQKYKQIKNKLTTMAIRSLIYIFITKMIIAIIMEYPVSMLLYNEAPLLPIIINSLFPPILMIMIVLWFRLPGKENTDRIYHRIIQIVNQDPSFESRTAMLGKKKREKYKLLNFIFNITYVATFGVTLYVIHELLNLLDFHLLSQVLFIFFISVVSFFSYRIKQVINEYRLVERDSITAPIIDFFFIPILSLGKLFNQGVAKINIFTVIFDLIIEAPFKLIIDVIEEWISFTRARKDEIA